MESSPSGRDRAAIWIGVAALMGFAVLVIYMFSLLTSSEATWSRALYLFAGVEAIAFAAAGYFFGREVNRQRAENAESRAGQAEQKAAEAAERAVEAVTRGQSLRAALQARAGVQLEGSDSGVRTAREIEELSRLAEELFPKRP
ncbi:hypothetical protein [uncultured Meiothermus sp.]|jgi:hypothetical protein|uniref:hypothetical protein n=1 Tax=uncultured Meiothermus sp. TaxID=157471 RepID=UPI00262E5D99|nr:hypothetical protein [uncultured Meiothermus sp.]